MLPQLINMAASLACLHGGLGQTAVSAKRMCLVTPRINVMQCAQILVCLSLLSILNQYFFASIYMMNEAFVST